MGSGQGDFARELLAHFPRALVRGLELSAAGVAIASAKVPQATFHQRDLLADERVPDAERGWATHAVCSEVLEHIDDPVRLLSHLRDYLAPGCRSVITVPAGPMTAFDRHLGHRRHFTRKELGDVIRAAQLIPDSIEAIGFPFFNLYRLALLLRGRRLISDVSGKPRPLARLAMAGFGVAFRFNIDRLPLGWQLVAVAKPGSRW